ncbi:mitochondrial mRNA pseudouridine synthase TRUB2 isoform X1 [Tupaia chinensis]|uniref:mitochondrial mRNA pseudouridine synthase TRUB2 isoform X1 n=1 Tax=Tupaia chinensis TaxID=246437 RepID=UPI0003C9058D|nr:mitochondrial mRNA pseudouridine synthase TRUB2 isoform X1 [Tupaia chinensis]
MQAPAVPREVSGHEPRTPPRGSASWSTASPLRHRLPSMYLSEKFQNFHKNVFNGLSPLLSHVTPPAGCSPHHQVSRAGLLCGLLWSCLDHCLSLPDHVTRGKLDRVLAVIQGSHQKALVMYSNLDLKTQEAYEMAVRGLIRPRNKSPMLVTGIQCCHFAPPEFVLEVQCLHETPQQLRRLVHEVGLELKTSAVCSQVRRTRDGFFTLDDALLRTHWDLHSIQDAIQAAAPRVAAELEKSLRPGLGTQQLSGPDQPWDSEDTSATLGLETHAGH